ncbi:OLC1v1015680C1 [Oldenlandia corymbosa var. corymbosa]|uniref:OLC1v1015680C1 n=1 Tax=Oldenlandia corymbosa var. corymbosa TaxID=529605 RepID=A0AAV1E6U5_OLDCO|nr:OLC1v1015680C1 [Oldenlandia corymbosa var. corymbosa]
MESSSLISAAKISTQIGRQTASPSLLQPETYHLSSSQSSFIGFKGNEDFQEVSSGHHQAHRWASDFFIEEQPHWLDDLLNEPDTQIHRNHRRSASDTFAYLGGLDTREDINRKMQSAHRSRVRKLQYISQLERTIQLLQAEGSEISAELEFLDRQNLILSMENKALKQRLDSITQEQLIKQSKYLIQTNSSSQNGSYAPI